jgi:aspartate aminotransferase-like enzyme
MPGPTPVPEETLLELAKPVGYHRSAEARKITEEIVRGLQTIFVTKNPIIPLTCSGSGSLEAALVNTVPAGKKAIVSVAGKFGERWRSVAQAFGIEPICITVPYGKVVTPEQVEQALAVHPDAVAVCSTLSETSTGVGHDIEAFGKIVARTPAVLLCDAISAVGAMECRTDEWHIDICCTGSQKALMMPPGLAFVSVSDKAWATIERNPAPRSFYFSLTKARKSIETFDTPFTPAHTLLKAMRLSVKRILDEGIENVWKRQTRYAEAARAGFQAISLKIFPERPTPALTVAESPIDSTRVLGQLEKQFGLKLANGQDSLKGKIIRLGHLGYIDQFDILAALSGIEIVLRDLGHPLEIGAGVAAAQRVFATKRN